MATFRSVRPKRKRKISRLGVPLRPVTVPEPTDYSARLEAARALLRRKGRTACIDPPPRAPLPDAQVFRVV